MDILSYILGKKAGGGGGEAVLVNKDISANGTYNASADSADGYKKVVVSVPNTYAAGDEGKVVSNGALVAQGSASYTSNGTYDTTTVNSVTVSVQAAADPYKRTFGNDLCLQNGSVDWSANTPSCTGYVNNNRRCILSANGDAPVYYYNSGIVGESGLYLIAIPSDATKVTITLDVSIQFAVREYVESDGSIIGSIATTGWTDVVAGVGQQVNLSTGTSYLGISLRVASNNANFDYSKIPMAIKVEFS